MKRVTLALALAIAAPVVATPALLLAQEEGAGKPPERTVKEPRRILDRIVLVYEDTQLRKTASALGALRDPSWAVRAFAAIRLGTLGLDEPTVRALRDAARPGSTPPAKDDKNVTAAETFAKDVKEKEAKDGRKAMSVGDEGIRTYASLVQNELSVKKAPADELRKIILTLPEFAEAADDPRARDFIARVLLSLSDEALILKEISAKDTAAAVAEGGKKVFEWFRSNDKYLYLHPREGLVHVDVAARSDATPTDKFRDKNPWKADEGPNAPPRKTRDVK